MKTVRRTNTTHGFGYRRSGFWVSYPRRRLDGTGPEVTETSGGRNRPVTCQPVDVRREIDMKYRVLSDQPGFP